MEYKLKWDDDGNLMSSSLFGNKTILSNFDQRDLELKQQVSSDGTINGVVLHDSKDKTQIPEHNCRCDNICYQDNSIPLKNFENSELQICNNNMGTGFVFSSTSSECSENAINALIIETKVFENIETEFNKLSFED